MILNEIVKIVKIYERDNFKNFDPVQFVLNRKKNIIDPIPLIRKGFFLIAEIKKASPSAGIIKENFDPLKIAAIYQKAGASAVSVLTERYFFKGSKQDLISVGENTHIPVLRKDFIIHPFQIYESYNMGADMILLIVACLSSEKFFALFTIATKLGLHVLVEVHSKPELKTALKVKPRIIGINNRDLTTFNTDLSVSTELIKIIPKDIYVISESGIETKDDILKIKNAGFSGALVGESLMRSKNIKKSIEELINV